MRLKAIKSFFYHFSIAATKEYRLKNIFLKMKYSNRLKQYKNLHNGERCFIIGNGPSLTSTDLDLIKNEYSFAANRIFYMFDKTEWRPTYYCAQDEVVISDIFSDFEKILSECRAMFLISNCKKYLTDKLLSTNNVCLFFARYTSAHPNRKFSKDITRYIDGGSTITYTAIQIAAYMGFKEIYLLGVDHNYSTSSSGVVLGENVVKSYFEGMPTNIKLTNPNLDASTLSYNEAKRYADENKIIIKNATRGGHLEVFDRINFDSLF